ncbi:choline/ethanolaminephosphotransferase 1 [Phtheirospermum japonicum]|uniref:Choline/ethanolaminephosphotransferase 1 n=1 Tax=Phtheirospermum japonicum TaxID=374723 RepID=A0A830BP49_9LAMI|nr:choline/ethanolaminephosphotransferase 1 [Phtheirospermum japonicum]
MDWRQTQRDIFTSVGLTSAKMGSFCAWIVALLVSKRFAKIDFDFLYGLSHWLLEAQKCVGGMLSGSGLYQRFLSTVLHGKDIDYRVGITVAYTAPFKYIFTSVGLTSAKMGSFCAWIVALLVSKRFAKIDFDFLYGLSHWLLEAQKCVGGMLSGSGLYQRFLSTVLHGKDIDYRVGITVAYTAPFKCKELEFYMKKLQRKKGKGAGEVLKSSRGSRMSL